MKLHKCFMVMAAMVALMLPCNANEAVEAAAKLLRTTNLSRRSMTFFGIIPVLFWGGASQPRLTEIAVR